MYIYRSGAVGKAVHAKIEAAKQSCLGKTGEARSIPFGELMKTFMDQRDTAKKPVSAVYGAENARTADGSALLYAMQNSGTDSTAAAVLNNIGFSISGSSSNQLKTAAEKLTASVNTLRAALSGESKETSAIALAGFVADYNDLMTRLAISGSTSAHLYRSSLSAYASEKALSGSGLSVSSGGMLSVSGEEADPEKLEPFLTGAASVAGSVSAYSGNMSGSGESLAAGYYGALMDLL